MDVEEFMREGLSGSDSDGDGSVSLQNKNKTKLVNKNNSKKSQGARKRERQPLTKKGQKNGSNKKESKSAEPEYGISLIH